VTRGRFDPPDAIEQAAAQLQSVQAAAGPGSLGHLAATESPHKSLAYPENDSQIDEPGLKKLFELSSPLPDRRRLAAEKPKVVKAESLAMVINCKFDLLLEGVKRALTVE
jgi:hypothetical protein